MKITRAEYFSEHLKLAQPYQIAGNPMRDSVEVMFVTLETDTGKIGWGSASPGKRVTGESAEDCKRALETMLTGGVAGGDLRSFRGLVRRVGETAPHAPAARCAVETALLDAFTQCLEIPLVDYLGRVRDGLPTSVTIGIKSAEESAEEAKKYQKTGFTILKVKIGDSMEEDVERLHRIREAVGDRMKIRVDANQGYSEPIFRVFLDRARRLDLELIEQPLPPEADHALAGFPDAVRSRLAADESLKSAAEAVTLANPPRKYGIYNIKLMKSGGILPALRIAGIAESAGIALMWGCNDESIVSISAALHAAMASPATCYLDLDGSLDLARDVVKGGFSVTNGELRVTGSPGLGVVPV